jgi:hypothetical protein
MSSNFSKLNGINLETKATQGKKYVPWNTLWKELCNVHPTATYEMHCDDSGVPFFNSPLGIFVKVSVTIDDLTHTMTRPVYNNAFKAMKIASYEYVINQGQTIKTVEAANAADVNDAQMRCFAKAIAMHGLGLFVFEDKPFADAELISSSQISEISNIISKNELMLSELFVAFGINKLSELAQFNYESAIGLMESAIKSQMSIENYIKSVQVQ